MEDKNGGFFLNFRNQIVGLVLFFAFLYSRKSSKKDIGTSVYFH